MPKDGALLYQIVTESRKETKVLSAAGEAVASWVRRRPSPNMLTLGKAGPVSINTWLRKSVIPFDRTFSAPTNPGKKYQWKGRTLYSKDESRSIATFSPSQRKRSLCFTVVGMKSNTQSTPAKLVVDAQGKEVLDFIVISCLQTVSPKADNTDSSPYEETGQARNGITGQLDATANITVSVTIIISTVLSTCNTTGSYLSTTSAHTHVLRI
ncbi:hypothetical protein BDP27DRAFT_1453079 [Rhodocollybia butyracea]|uniref:DUF6593 domain-containing protein n=1 Tax=Rhodocollybia butyracea TaxID=206335 RepID=A0A9P5P7K3_9AGAR|nr:hypothetical protein BDP27DRAFT_1453079 [Rhodocollybia butyracea]